MLTDMATDPGGAGRLWAAVVKLWRSVGMGGPLAASLAAFVAYKVARGSIDWGQIAAMIAAVAGIIIGRMALHREPDSESRDRVLEAERELEDALRQAPTVPAARTEPTIPPARTEAAPGTDEDADVVLPPPPALPAPVFPARTPLGLPELWKVTHSRLDHYHETVLGQARRSFWSAQAAMWIGFALLGAFVWVAVKASTTAGSIVAGGLGAVSAALAGYVSRTFVKSQDAAAGHLRAYFDQPLAFARYLAAERLLQDSGMDETKRSEVLGALVLAMAADPKAPPSEDKPASPSE